jgi:hypothetical protein
MIPGVSKVANPPIIMSQKNGITTKSAVGNGGSAVFCCGMEAMMPDAVANIRIIPHAWSRVKMICQKSACRA